MASIPKKVAERLVAGIKKYQSILTAAKARDAGEADTSTIVKMMMADIFGYDLIEETISEHQRHGALQPVATATTGHYRQSVTRLVIQNNALPTQPHS